VTLGEKVLFVLVVVAAMAVVVAGFLILRDASSIHLLND
jgi:cell division protein FtsL